LKLSKITGPSLTHSTQYICVNEKPLTLFVDFTAIGTTGMGAAGVCESLGFEQGKLDEDWCYERGDV